jgi:hypothetical protein
VGAVCARLYESVYGLRKNPPLLGGGSVKTMEQFYVMPQEIAKLRIRAWCTLLGAYFGGGHVSPSE